MAGVANLVSNLYTGRRLVYLDAFSPEAWLETVRKEQERIDSHRSRNEIKRDQFDPASFGKVAPEILDGPRSYRILSHLPPPTPLQKRTVGDLVASSAPSDGQVPENDMAA